MTSASESVETKVGSRPRSSVGFPYYSLGKSIEVAKAIHDRAGGRCDRGQLAAILGYSGVKNGGFLTRISAAKMFGLIEESGDSITLSDRSKRILSPVRASDSAQAKLDAFMSVELYRRVYEEFEGHTLPGADGLTNLLLNQYKVVPNQVPTALRNLLDSADSAGLFEVGGRTRLITPLLRSESVTSAVTPVANAQVDQGSTTQAAALQAVAPNSRSDSATQDLSDVHPALLGLLQNLPPPGMELGPKRRAALIEAFKHTINFVYPEREDQ